MFYLYVCFVLPFFLGPFSPKKDMLQDNKVLSRWNMTSGFRVTHLRHQLWRPKTHNLHWLKYYGLLNEYEHGPNISIHKLKGCLCLETMLIKLLFMCPQREGGYFKKIFKFKKHILKKGFIVIIVMKTSAYWFALVKWSFTVLLLFSYFFDQKKWFCFLKTRTKVVPLWFVKLYIIMQVRRVQ